MLCGAGAQGASRKEAAGEEVEGSGTATVRSHALSAGPFLPCTTQPNSPLLAGSDLHPVVFLAFSLQLSECTPHERGDAFIFVVEKRSRGRGNVTAGKSMGFEAQEKLGLDLSSAIELGVLHQDSLTALHLAVPSVRWT